MAKHRYEVVRPWIGGPSAGEVFELEKPINKAFLSNVKSTSRDGAKLTPATPAAVCRKLEGKDKGVIIERLKELKIDYDGRKSADELAALLPEGELAALFPAQ